MKKVIEQFENGFTLAEVLITLVIIGVIAALTIPAAVAYYQKEETIAQLKQVYSQLNQAIRLSVPEHGDPRTWDYSLTGIDFFNEYLNNYIQIKRMSLDANEIRYQRTDGSVENGFNPLKDGANVIVLNSGAIIYISNSSPSSSATSLRNSLKQKGFAVDTNGLKGPNKIGRDLFFFFLDGENGMVFPRSCDDTESATVERSRDELKNGPSAEDYQCNKSGRGMWCAALIIKDGWQIKDDYPW